MAGCITDEILARLLEDQLEGDERSAIVDHVESCAGCQERLKELTRGRAVNRKTIEEFVAELPLDTEAKAALLRLEPRGYLGLAAELVERFTPHAGAKSKP